MTEPCDLSAREARRLIGNRKLSPVELLDSCIERTDAVNPSVNAMVATCYDRARDEAKEFERLMMQGNLLPLHGLPIGIKDLSDTEGLVTTYGSPLYKDHVPDQDGQVVANLRAAGAVVVGKTNTPEFGAGSHTVNPVYGATVNPFDTGKSAGGSSGGSAVALACGMVPLCSGSDSGGSLRNPAAYSGVSAHRGTPGLVPHPGKGIGYTTANIQGPMARDMADVSMMMAVQAGFDTRDPLSVGVDPEAYWPLASCDLSELRVAFSTDLGFATVDDKIREVFEQRVSRFRYVFRTAEDRDPDMGEVRKAYPIIRALHFLDRHRDHYENHRDQLAKNVIENYETGLKFTAQDVAWALTEQTRIFRNLDRLFDDVDLLICPAVAVPPFPTEQRFVSEINGVQMESYIEWMALCWGLTVPGNPISAIPCGIDHQGTPFGLQICGRFRNDAAVIAAARALEELFTEDEELARPLPDLSKLKK